jgi:hypothetical protein
MWLDITEALWQNLSYPSPPWLCVGFFYLAVINDLIHNILKAFFFFFSQFQPLHQKSWHKIGGALLILSKKGFMLQKISVLSQLMITVLR